MFSACRDGDVEALHRALGAGADVSAVNYRGRTALTVAITTPNVDPPERSQVLRVLLGAGADPNHHQGPATEHPGWTPLHHAAVSIWQFVPPDEDTLMEPLLDAGAHPDARNSAGETPLLLKCRKGADLHSRVLRLLVEYGADVNAADSVGRTALFYHGFAWAGLESGRYPEELRRPLQQYAEERLRVLEEHGAEHDLVTAILFGKRELASRLLVARPDLANATGQGGQGGFTPLCAAALAGDVQTAGVLLDLGADIDGANSAGAGLDDPRRARASHSYRDTPKSVASLAADSSKDFKENRNTRQALGSLTDSGGARPIHAAVVRESTELLSLLLNRGADINAGDGRGRTPLHLAALCQPPSFAAYLLRRGADANTQDSAGQTPLHVAAEHSYPQLIEVLLDGGADPNVRDKWGLTPLHLLAGTWWGALDEAPAGLSTEEFERLALEARDQRKAEGTELLLAAGADPNNQSIAGHFPLDCLGATDLRTRRLLNAAGAQGRLRRAMVAAMSRRDAEGADGAPLQPADLKAHIVLNFHDTPAETALKYLAHLVDDRMVCDELALYPRMGRHRRPADGEGLSDRGHTGITLVFDGTLSEGLDAVCGELGLTWELEDGVIRLSRHEDASGSAGARSEPDAPGDDGTPRALR
jgi:ankyrin repeat protein